MIVVKYIQEFLWSRCGQCEVNSVLDSSWFQLVFVLKVYRSLPMLSQCQLQVFNLLHLSLPERFPLLCLFWLPLFASPSVSNFHPDTRGRRQSLIQAHLFSCVVGREEHCKQISLVCCGVLTVYGPHWVCRTLRCVCFPGLHCSGSRLLCRGTIQSGP